ncbi:hypothetical protein LPJ61_005770 [Coemansia biformis]|uniref:Uncharacterized protein n=1 Tax=Coemansia biformis TaxID=1286918 RepID=A0A9W7Y640_9FUNG|nr:hypothetical protein LPJ61_005770 [Coemansia biformis]
MAHSQLDRRNMYVYRQLSQEQATRLVSARAAILQEEGTCTGLLLLTEREYCLLVPLLNPLVIAQNRRRLKELCKVADVSKKGRQKMVRNLWLQSCMGFVPIVNVVFARKFKCNTRNLAILEAQMQMEEDEILFRHSDGTAGEGALPTHISKMFSRCPVYRRAEAPSSRRESAALSVYYSATASLADLGQSHCAASTGSAGSSLDCRLSSTATLADAKAMAA